MILHTQCRGCRKLITLPAPSHSDSYCDRHRPAPGSTAAELDRLEDAFLQAVLAGELAEADRLADTLDQAWRGSQTLSARVAAVAYAGHGWPVFPLVVGGKTPATKNGFKDATTDPDRIVRYWERHPNANIGVATGVKFDVIDVDYGHPGAALKWADIRDSGIEFDALVTTPGGLHAYRLPTGAGNSAAVGGHKGIDYRGKGGYVVVPPSVRPDGRYRWWSYPSPRLLKG